MLVSNFGVFVNIVWHFRHGISCSGKILFIYLVYTKHYAKQIIKNKPGEARTAQCQFGGLPDIVLLFIFLLYMFLFVPFESDAV